MRWVLLLSVSAVIASGLQIGLASTGHGFFLLILGIGVCVLASWHDTATFRIPNVLTYTAILIGLAINGASSGFEALGFDLLNRWAGASGWHQSLLGFGFSAGLGLLCLYVGGLGGGDMKLLCAIGAILGFDLVLIVYLNALVIGLAYALVNLLLQGRLTLALHYVACSAVYQAYTREPLPFLTNKKNHVPLAVPVLIGLIIAPFLAL